MTNKKNNDTNHDKHKHVKKVGKDTKICIFAGDKIIKNDKLFRPYLSLANINTKDYMDIYSIKKDIDLYITQNVKPDKDGKYIGKYSRTKISNKNNEIIVEGGIEMLKRDIHDYLTNKYGNKIIGSYQPTRIYINNGNKHINFENIPLYNDFDLSTTSIDCD